jgi:hypothetical protein
MHHSVIGLANRECGLVTVSFAPKFGSRHIEDLEEDGCAPLSAMAPLAHLKFADRETADGETAGLTGP